MQLDRQSIEDLVWKVRTFLQKAEIKEAIETISSFISDYKIERYSQEVIALSARYYQNENSQRKGIESSHNIQLERNKIIFATLYLLNEIRKKSIDKIVPQLGARLESIAKKGEEAVNDIRLNIGKDNLASLIQEYTKSIESRMETPTTPKFEILPTPSKIKIVILNHKEDEKYRSKLRQYLIPLQRNKTISIWDSNEVKAGEEEETIMDEKLKEANIVLFLVSANSMTVESIFDRQETVQKMAEDKKQALMFVPILISSFDCEFKQKSLPSNGTPVNKWNDPEDAWADITKSLKRVIDEFNT